MQALGAFLFCSNDCRDAFAANLLTHQQPSFDIKPLYNREQTVRRVNIFETRQQFAENITMITIEIAIGVSYSACVRKWVLWVRRDCPV